MTNLLEHINYEASTAGRKFSAARAAKHQFVNIGLDVPTPLAEAIADHEAAVATLKDYGDVDRDAVAAAVADNLVAGKDPQKAKGVAEFTATRALAEAGLVYPALDMLAEQCEASIRASAPEALTILNTAVDEQIVILDGLPTGLSTRHKASMDAGIVPRALLGDWGRARSAIDRIEAIGAAWVAVIHGTGPLQPFKNKDAAAIFADVTPEDIRVLGDLGLATRKAGPAVVGLDCRLVTKPEFTERVEALRQAVIDEYTPADDTKQVAAKKAGRRNARTLMRGRAGSDKTEVVEG